VNLPLKIYKSSAGSGKTFTLVKEYLKLCLPNPDRFRYILAITFTNAAAAEMKDRILKTLAELAAGRGQIVKNILLQEGLSQESINNAALLLENILYNYSRFNISTIDSFFQKIIRSFNKELGLPSDFEIFIETDEALDYAVDQFLYHSRELPEIHALLVDYIREKISNSKSWDISADLYRIAKELLKDRSIDIPESDLETIRAFIKDVKKMSADFETEMDRLANLILKKTAEFGITLDDFKNKKGGIMSFVLKSLKDIREYVPNIRFVNGLTDPKEWYTKDSAKMRLIEEAMESSLLPLCISLYDYWQQHYKMYRSAREILRNIYTFAVYEELNKSLGAYRQEKNAVLIADFTKILSTHIVQEDVSFVYSKIGSRYDHYLVDEFQDTSDLQWKSLKPLVENAVSQGSSCLIVGDSKQAIYRWRGGSVTLLEQQIAEIDFPAHSEKLDLNRNFRSSNIIVDFNNRFFKNVSGLFENQTAEYQLLGRIFKNAFQHSSEPSPGYAEVNFIVSEGRTREAFLEPARKLMTEQLQRTLNAGYKPKDVAILVRDKKDAAVAARLLHEKGLPFITQDSLNLDHSPAVRLLLSLLNYVYDPEDLLAKAEILQLYHLYFNTAPDAEFNHLSIVDTALPVSFADKLPELNSMPVYALTEALISLFSLNAEDAYLQRFLDAVLEYSIKEKGSIKGFMEWWEKGKFTVVLPEGQDAIQIITIHKSKGLEFPVVLIPFADWDFNNSKPDIIWAAPGEEPFDKFPLLPVNFSSGLKDSIFENDYIREEALTVIDNLNLLYVALTRAKSRLYINTSQVKKAPENGIKNIPSLISSVLNAFGTGDKMVFGSEGDER
jgi:ATP-dependent helicase/nuclease subunit A